jgi:hypothetical protein
MDTKKTQLKDHGATGRYKPIKLEPSDSMVKMLRSLVTALQSISENVIACDNSDCRELITFCGNEARPIVCRRCGRDIKWECRQNILDL